MQLVAHFDHEGSRSVKLLKDYNKRIKKLISQFIYLLANKLLDELYDLIPQDEEYKEYRESLEVVRVTGVPQAVSFAITTMSNEVPKGPKGKEVILFIKAKRRLREPDPIAVVLEKYNPWTSDTLPYRPDRKDAVIIHKRASELTLKRASESKKKKKVKWLAELTKAGFKPNKAASSELEDLIDEIVQDNRAKGDTLAQQAVQLEFGLGGVRAAPHWRPALMHVMTRVVMDQIIKENPAFKLALRKASYMGWKNWPEKTNTISLEEAKKFAEFVKKLGVNS